MSGTVTNVVGGTGLLGGSITTAGTLNVDVGTTANRILQLNPSAKIPAVDGSLLFNVNASYLAGGVISSTLAPTDGQVLSWNAAGSKWIAANSVTYVGAGTGILGGPISTAGTLAVDVGSAAGKIVIENASAQIAQKNGSASAPSFTFANDPGTGVYSPAATRLGVSVSGTNILQAVGTTSFGPAGIGIGTADPLAVLDVYGLGNASAIVVPRDTTTARPAAAQNGMIRYNTTTSAFEVFANNVWSSLSTGSWVSNVTAGAGLNGGAITSTGTLTVDTGTVANKILQLNSGAKIPAVDGSLLFNVNATSLGTAARPISSTAPLNTQVLAWNSSTTTWLPTFGGTGTVTVVAPGTGLVGGTITTTGTLSVDVGSAALKIPRLNTNAGLALADGTATAPTYGFYGSTNMGIYRNGGDIALSLAGTPEFDFSSNGLTIGSGATSTLALEITGTGPQSGVLLPRDSSVNRPASIAGTMRYNTTNGVFEGYTNAAGWVGLLTSGAVTSGEVQFGSSTNGVLTSSSNLTFTTSSGLTTGGAPTALTANGAASINGNLSVTGTSTFQGPVIANNSSAFNGSVNQRTQTVAASGSAGYVIDASTGNLFTTNNPCGPAGPKQYNLSNLVDGQSITIVNTDTTAAKCAFAGTGAAGSYTFYFMPANDQRVNGAQTIYNFLVVGSSIYVTWSSGFVSGS